MSTISGSKPSNARRRRISYGMLPDLIGYNMRRAQVAIFLDFARALDGHDVTPGQFGVLTLIDGNPGLNQSELGEAMGVDRSTVVAVIDRLEARKWVARHPAPNDRRSYALELTDEGRALLDRLRPLVSAHEGRLAAGLSEAERASLIALLRRVIANLG